MKLLVVLALAVLAAQAAEIPKLRDLSKYQPRSVLFPRTTEPKLTSDGFVPRKPSPKNKMAETCGVPNVPVKDSRVVGGQEADPNEFPWQVAVFIDDTYFCGGSLINSEWVMTAAHCADGAEFFIIVLGAHNVRVIEPTQIQVNTSDYVVHPNWRPSIVRNDIALIRLPKPVTFTDAISPICLPGPDSIEYGGGELLVSGWGIITDDSPSISPTLNWVQLPAITNEECRQDWPNLAVDSNVCCSTTQGTASCNGDSGGPLSDIDAVTDIFTQVGIVSFGSSAGCAAGYADVYTRVSSYITDFILPTINPKTN